MRGQPRISPIYSRGADLETAPSIQQDRDRADLRKYAWHKYGLIVADPEDMLNDFDRDFLISLANKIYGNRRAK